MADLLTELERVRGLVAAYDDWRGTFTKGSQRALTEARTAAFDLIRRPDFLALIEALREPVAWLHAVVGDDGEPDQALSFSPDNFPLEGVAGYRKVSCRPLYALHTKERDDG